MVVRGARARLATVILASAIFVSPAKAQIAVSATATSNYQYRGVTLSDGKPALSVNIAYDPAIGAYVGAAVIGAKTEFAGVQGLGHVEYLGYAGRLKNGLTWDIGVTNTHVTNYYYQKYKYDIAEAYAGIRVRHLNYYLYYSPNYYRAGVNTLYAQISGSVRIARPWRLFGNAGALTSLGGGGYGVFREQYDLGVGVAADLKVAEVQLAVTTRGPDVVYLADHPQSRHAIVLSATHYF